MAEDIILYTSASSEMGHHFFKCVLDLLPLGIICHCGLAGNTLVEELTVRGFNPRYRQMHSGSDDHLKWRSSVIWSYPQWQVKEPQGC